MNRYYLGGPLDGRKDAVPDCRGELSHVAGEFTYINNYIATDDGIVVICTPPLALPRRLDMKHLVSDATVASNIDPQAVLDCEAARAVEKLKRSIGNRSAVYLPPRIGIRDNLSRRMIITAIAYVLED